MSRIELWKQQEAARIELERSSRIVAYEHNPENTLGLMDRPMSLGEFMEGMPDGFSTFLEKEGYSEPRFENDELAGYREVPIWRRDSAMDELESLFRGGYAELEVGPYEVEIPIIFGTFRNNMDKGLGFEESFSRAAWHFQELTREYEQNLEIVSAGIRTIHEQCGNTNTAQWAIEKMMAALGNPPSPVVLKMDPVVEDLPTQRDAECRWDHLALAHLEEMAAEEKILQSTSRKYSCFGRGKDAVRLASPEEKGHHRELGERREQRFSSFMRWVERASRAKLEEAFCRQPDGSDGRFWARLKASRNKCYPRSSKYEGDTLSSRADVWLSKPQVDSIWGLAKKRLGIK